QVQLAFENKGTKGAVYHVYDMNRLDKIPRRYTVEAGKSLADEWDAAETGGRYDLEVYGPNGYFRKFAGNIHEMEPEIQLDYDHRKGGIFIGLQHQSAKPIAVDLVANAYGYPATETITIPAGQSSKKHINLKNSSDWYDFTIKTAGGFSYRFAGRVETDRHGVSDPAMAAAL